VFHVVLYQPEIPPNTGNIGRLCLATGCRLHLIRPLGFQLDDKSLRRAGLDYWQHLDVQIWDSLDALLATAAPAAQTFYLTTKTDRPHWDARFRDGDYLVFGPETRGLPEKILAAHPEGCLTLPMANPGDHVRSLNLATAAAAVVYEALRQAR
jgi:tRNA (cytidine/uridine-2'-O-)-methyltransferase